MPNSFAVWCEGYKLPFVLRMCKDKAARTTILQLVSLVMVLLLMHNYVTSWSLACIAGAAGLPPRGSLQGVGRGGFQGGVLCTDGAAGLGGDICMQNRVMTVASGAGCRSGRGTGCF